MKKIYLKISSLLITLIMITSMLFVCSAATPTYLDLSATKTSYLLNEESEIKIYSDGVKLEANDSHLSYDSSDALAFEISDDGTITALAYGCSIITVTYTDDSGSECKNSLIVTCSSNAPSGNTDGSYTEADPSGIEDRTVAKNQVGNGDFGFSIPDSKNAVMNIWFYDDGESTGSVLNVIGTNPYSHNHFSISSNGYSFALYTTLEAQITDKTGNGQTTKGRSKGWHQLSFVSFRNNSDDTKSETKVFVDGEMIYKFMWAGNMTGIRYTKSIYTFGMNCVKYEFNAEVKVDGKPSVALRNDFGVTETIEAQFNTNISDTDNVDELVYLEDKDTENKVEVDYEISGNKITVTPKYPLNYNTQYRFKLKKDIGISSVINKNVTLGSDKAFVFTTEKNSVYVESFEDISDTSALKATATLVDTISNSDVYAVMTVYKNNVALETVTKKWDNTNTLEISSTLSDITDCTAEVIFTDSISGSIISSYTDVYKIGETVKASSSKEYDTIDTVVDISMNQDTGKIIITGKSKTNRALLPVIIRVVNPVSENSKTPFDFSTASESNFKDVYNRFEQILTKADGYFGYEIPISGVNGTYNVIVNLPYETTSYSKTINYVSTGTITTLLSDLNGADDTNIASRVEAAVETLGFNTKTVKNKQYIYNYILSKAGSYTDTETFKNDYLTAETNIVKLESSNESAIKYLSDNEAALLIKDLKSYEYFKQASEAVQTKLIEKIKLIGADSEIKDILNDNIVIESLKNINNYSLVYKIIEDFTNAGLLTANLSGYGGIGETNQVFVQQGIIDNMNTLTSNTLISEKFNELVTTYTPGSSGSGSSSSGSSSSGSSGSSGSGAFGGSSVSTSTPSSNTGSITGTLIDDPSDNESYELPQWVQEEKAAEAEAEMVFSDLNQAEWAREFIKDLYTKDIVSGYPDGSFGVNKSITREEIVKLIVLAGNLKSNGTETAAFADVAPNAWYYEYVKIAVENGIVNGIGDNKFGIGQNITREEMSAMLYRLADSQGIFLDEEITIHPFKDQEEISDWAEYPVKVLRESFLISGYEGNYFKPKDNLTRAQAAKMIYGYIHYND